MEYPDMRHHLDMQGHHGSARAAGEIPDRVHTQRRNFWRAWKIMALLAIAAGAIGGAIWRG
jgi:hypothetical protein